eukprot:22456-Hanusia_phi.AAC.4
MPSEPAVSNGTKDEIELVGLTSENLNGSGILERAEVEAYASNGDGKYLGAGPPQPRYGQLLPTKHEQITAETSDTYLAKLRLAKIGLANFGSRFTLLIFLGVSGFVFQTFNLLATMSAFENVVDRSVELPMTLLGVLNKKERQARAVELLTTVHLLLPELPPVLLLFLTPTLPFALLLLLPLLFLFLLLSSTPAPSTPFADAASFQGWSVGSNGSSAVRVVRRRATEGCHRESELAGGRSFPSDPFPPQALANKPELLLLDEPTGDLDTRNTVLESCQLLSYG